MSFLDFIPFVTKIIDRVIPDPKAAADAKMEVLKLQINDSQFTAKIANDLVQSQLDINKIEAASPNLFVSGGRPFILWICGLIFAANYLIIPVTSYILTILGHPVIEMPKLDMGEMMPVLGGLLGLGAMRSYERVKGVIPKGK